jgi:opacity protein-like surface antigen
MPPTLKNFTIAAAVLLSFCTVGYAQHGRLPYANQVNANQVSLGQISIGQPNVPVGRRLYDQFGQPIGYDGYPYQYPSVVPADPVNELYNHNAQKPLMGLFAKGFTRTLTLLGGANFLPSIENDGRLLNSTPAGGGPSNFALDSETGYAISFAFGRRHNHRLRSEIELALRANETSFESDLPAMGDIFEIALDPNGEDKIRAYSIMKNFIYGFQNTSRFTPYLGVGLGWSYIDLEATSVGIDDGSGAFSYQAIGGVATTVNSVADFIVEYRFLGTTDVDLDGFAGSGGSINYQTHNLFLGVKFEY